MNAGFVDAPMEALSSRRKRRGGGEAERRKQGQYQIQYITRALFDVQSLTHVNCSRIRECKFRCLLIQVYCRVHLVLAFTSTHCCQVGNRPTSKVCEKTSSTAFNTYCTEQIMHIIRSGAFGFRLQTVYRDVFNW